MGQSGKLSPADLSTKITTLAVSGIIAGIPTGTTNTLAFDGALDATQLQAALAALGQTAAAPVASSVVAAPVASTTAVATGGNGRGNGRNNRNGA